MYRPTHLIHKDRPHFWKAWNARFKNNLSKDVIINGHVKDEEIANDFASYFRSVFYNSDVDVDSKMSYYNFCDSVANKGSTSECSDFYLRRLKVSLIIKTRLEDASNPAGV